MSRPLRIEFAGALYHVMARGNAREAIFRDDSDREAFVSGLARVCDRFAWRVWAYCLMDNHYHLLVETLRPSLSRGMREVNGVYTQAFNRRHGRVGHVLQGRYKAVLVDKEAYLLELLRNIVLNPVRARMYEQAAAKNGGITLDSFTVKSVSCPHDEKARAVAALHFMKGRYAGFHVTEKPTRKTVVATWHMVHERTGWKVALGRNQ